jgi:hypothetical protein
MLPKLYGAGFDVYDVRKRDAEAAADGFPVARELLTGWRDPALEVEDETGNIKDEYRNSHAAENSEFDNPEELRDESTEEICPPGSDYRC